MAKEKVLTVPEVNTADINSGLTVVDIKEDINKIRELLKDGLFKIRDQVENDPSFKQIIPYCYIVIEGDNEDGSDDQILLYQRSKKGNESRLTSQWSIGFGGHVNPEDVVGKEHIETVGFCCHRELSEELIWPEIDKFDIEMVGILNDTGDIQEIEYPEQVKDVGNVHLGFVFELRISPETLKELRPNPKEVSIIKTSSSNLQETLDLYHFEPWSQIILREIIKSKKEEDIKRLFG